MTSNFLQGQMKGGVLGQCHRMLSPYTPLLTCPYLLQVINLCLPVLSSTYDSLLFRVRLGISSERMFKREL